MLVIELGLEITMNWRSMSSKSLQSSGEGSNLTSYFYILVPSAPLYKGSWEHRFPMDEGYILQSEIFWKGFPRKSHLT